MGSAMGAQPGASRNSLTHHAVLQTPNLFPGTVAANVAFGPRQAGKQLEATEIAVLLERGGLPRYHARDVANLSGGEA